MTIGWAEGPIDDPTLDPCADIDHRDCGSPFRFRVYTADLGVLVNNWKKKDAQLPGDCPRADGAVTANVTLDELKMSDKALLEAEIERLHDAGPSAHWTMDDNAANTTVADSSGNANDGTAQRDTSALTTTGVINGALTFDGTNDYIEVPEQIEWVLDGDFTITLWVKFDTFNSNWWESAFVAQDEGGGPGNKWIFSYDPVSETTVLHINSPSIAGPVIQGDSWTAQAGVWYFVGLSRSGSTYTFYKQGLSNGSSANSTAIPDAAVPLTIGWAEGPAKFDGAMDDVRIYSRALSAAEIGDLYDEGARP